MSNVLLCKGTLATTPYYLKEACVNIFSIEELCYYVYNNAYLLDDDFVCEPLAKWIEEKLSLKMVANSLRRVLGKENALANLVVILNNEIGYYTEEEWRNLVEDIANNSKKTMVERRKYRADGLLANKRYVKSFEEYEGILRDEIVEDNKTLAKIYHNLGVCAAKLFLFKQAAEYFEKAYNAYANTESYMEMLCAMKMYMKPTEYLGYLADHKESYEDSLEVERKLEILKLSFKEHAAYKYFRELEQSKMDGTKYFGAIDSLSNRVKEEYRGY